MVDGVHGRDIVQCVRDVVQDLPGLVGARVPAAGESPTSETSNHSNFLQKVLELRHQKEVVQKPHPHVIARWRWFYGCLRLMQSALLFSGSTVPSVVADGGDLLINPQLKDRPDALPLRDRSLF